MAWQLQDVGRNLSPMERNPDRVGLEHTTNDVSILTTIEGGLL